MCIDTIEYSIILRECRGCKWKCRRETTSRDISVDRDFITTKGCGGSESLFCTEESSFCEDIAPVEHILDIVGQFCELIVIVSVECDIDRKMEILLRSTSKKCSQFFYVF